MNGKVGGSFSQSTTLAFVEIFSTCRWTGRKSQGLQNTKLTLVFSWLLLLASLKNVRNVSLCFHLSPVWLILSLSSETNIVCLQNFPPYLICSAITPFPPPSHLTFPSNSLTCFPFPPFSPVLIKHANTDFRYRYNTGSQQYFFAIPILRNPL